MSEQLRIGIIGAGGIARNAHIPNYQNYKDDIQVVAVANHNKEKAVQCAETFSIPNAYEDYQSMLEEMNLDAVSICTPNKFHAEQAIASLQAGCHVLCEKPPAISKKEAEAMVQEAEKSGKVLTYGFHFRYSPEVETLKKFIDAGELGEIYASRAHYNRRRGIPGWGVFTNQELQGGGTLIDNGVHMLDTVLYLMGYPEPKTVLGATYQKIGNRPGVGVLGEWDYENFSVEDMARGMITFTNGASLTFESTFAANVEEISSKNVTLMGDQGGADLFPLKIYQEKHDILLDSTPAYLEERDVYKHQVHHFIESILHGKQPLSTAREGVILQAIMEALYKSAKTGEAVNI
ncbi:gfo/Idh/MocA family oxidoreductase [Pontibacillus yanchengensis]|uniref:Gfo/Idh/MocA family oxidoreductase n=2 Tax=Pontibacillus yanchengensis TaxID=462910 RepID=A0ACC7VF95_9BACI|nr:Gfo/Idh/MocA family oxidoreductase [Pontibacillus yanchengensis]MYL32284.1 gfo/Idh/MocA family oxidoreductase [Pontibacillus yanchengensis]MYL52864.1 gfo/Idh/MocA family oxidoreductase [Pontibacillus yanchengensis]